jgi:chemotaxis protein CheD
MMAENVRSVAIGEMVVSGNINDVLVVYGLGSCVAVCLYDPVARVGGMLHALLPYSREKNGGGSNPIKFVDQGTPRLIDELLKAGGRRSRLKVSLCGGAQVISTPGFDGRRNIGEHNVLAAEAALKKTGLRVQAQSTGGRAGRTVKLYVADGQVVVKTLGKGLHTLQPG